MEITEINVYPIKSLGKISLSSSVVEEKGLRNDRRLMLVDKNNELLSQREIPKMATLETALNENSVIVSAENFGRIKIPLEFDEETSEEIFVKIWNDFCRALVAEKFVNEWFRDFLEIECRIVSMPAEERRPINKIFNRGNEIVSFADGYPLLLIGENSLRDLNSKLEKPVPMDRFRPNLVAAGMEAFAEDNWKKIRIGRTIFRSTKPCARCSVTTVDQKTGVPDKSEPLKTLAAYRKASDVFPEDFEKMDLKENSVLFGQNLVAENFGEEINSGDEIEVLE